MTRNRNQEREFARALGRQFVENNASGENRRVRRRMQRDLARQIARDIASGRKNRDIETATDKHEGSEDASGG